MNRILVGDVVSGLAQLPEGRVQTCECIVVSERPILFSGAMVRAILSGAKTQTRRIVKPQPQMVTDTSIEPWRGVATDLQRLLDASGRGCPYGQPGDRLYVRESFNLGRPLLNCEGVADDEELWIGRLPKDDPRKQPFMSAWRVGYAADGCEGKMRPSIHMPRWASRLTLGIIGVRVERLQAISEADARAEGAIGAVDNSIGNNWCARQAFSALWESINGPGSWDANPWVWVVEFRRIAQEARAAA